jgi:cyanophycinase
MVMKHVIVIFLYLMLLGSMENANAKNDGYLFIIGGGKRPNYMIKKYVELAGGNSAKIVIIPMASGRPLDAALYQKYQLENCGAGKVDFIIFNRENADTDSILSVLDNASGVFFSGGAQRRLVGFLNGTKLLEKVRSIYKNGGTIGGTSAGAAVMSDIMITGDELSNPDSTQSFSMIKKNNIDISQGFGFIKSAIIDQHFVKRKRHNRLISLVLENPSLIGIGIDEATAIILRPDKTFEVLGENTVIIYDGSKIQNKELDKNDNYAATGMIMHILKSGDIFDLNRNQD